MFCTVLFETERAVSMMTAFEGLLDQAASQFQDAPAPEVSAELKPLADAILQLLQTRQYQEVISRSEQLLQQAQVKNDPVARLHALSYQAFALQRMGRHAEAAVAFQLIENLSRELGDTAFEVEARLYRAVALWRVNQLSSEQALHDALRQAAQEQRRPIAVANACNSAAIEWNSLGEYEKARRCAEHARLLYARFAPNSLGLAHSLNNLGAIAYMQGDLGAAQQYFEQALPLYEQLTPNSPTLAVALGNLGMLTQGRGDLRQAMRYYDRALKLFEQLEPNSLNLATTLNNISGVALQMGDFSLAIWYLEQVLAIEEAIEPDSPRVADTLNNLGYTLQRLGMHREARERYNRALALYEKHVPNSPRVASILGNLGTLESESGNWGQARQYFERAHAIIKQVAPDSLTAAIMLANLGAVAIAQGDLNRAEDYCQQAATLQERLAPDSLSHANTLQKLARIALQRGQLPTAQSYLEKAIAIIEGQRRTLPDPETRTLFAEQHFDAYPLLAIVHLQLQQTAKAVETLERCRSRALAEAMQYRSQAIANLPKALRQILEEQERLSTQRLRASQALLQAQAGRGSETSAPAEALKRIDAQLRFLDQRLHQEFPRYAELLQPQPLTLAEIQRTLDAGQVMLYHAIVENYLIIIALSRTELRHALRPVNTEQLLREVKRFIEIAAKPPGLRTNPERRILPVLAKQLYQYLVAPVASALRDAQRVLLCPEGIFNYLPWGALVVSEQKGKPIYWIEQKSIHLTSSASVYQQARGVQTHTQGVAIASVSKYGGRKVLAQRHSPTDSLSRRASRSGRLDDLRHVPVETEQIRRLFGAQVRLLRESQARPESVRVAAQQARVIHFACHALADSYNPVNSALLLSPAAKEDGALFADEVITRWRLRADLVMLSACETHIGLARRYEGIYGLSRAFLYAGSRSVGASLWRVDDTSTAILMSEFYRQYKQRVPKDKALQIAQQQLLRNPRYRDPYFWAGFVLIGDYR